MNENERKVRLYWKGKKGKTNRGKDARKERMEQMAYEEEINMITRQINEGKQTDRQITM